MPMSETEPNELVHYSVENKVATSTGPRSSMRSSRMVEGLSA
jgi:hypothetical protein